MEAVLKTNKYLKTKDLYPTSAGLAWRDALSLVFCFLPVCGTSKLADHQKIESLLGASMLKQSESLQCKFLCESLLVPLTPNSLAVQAGAT